MAKSDDAPLEVTIPKTDQPVWSRVGVIGVLGFVLGIAWPKLAGVKVGPSVPGDLKPVAEASALPVTPGAAPNASSSPNTAATNPSAQASADAAANQELVVVGNGKVVKCSDKKERDKKVECDEIAFDKIALPKLKELSKCPSALGLAGKVTLGFELNFDKKEVSVSKPKKGSSTLPSSTVNGLLQCAGKELQGVGLEEVAHKHHRYALAYELTFYPPGKHPDTTSDDGKDDDDAPKSADSANGESSLSGSAVVSWDTALVRKQPKDGEVVARLVRGTKVRLLAKDNDWYKVETGSKTGWMVRNSIGM